MADSIFSRSLFSLVAIKAATFATYLVHTYPQEEDEAEGEEKKKQRFCNAVRTLFSPPTSKFFCIVVAFRYHKFVTKFFVFSEMSFTRTSGLLHVSSRIAFCFVLCFFFLGVGAVGVSVVVVENQLVLVGRKQQQ
jgi:hypothetical protein